MTSLQIFILIWLVCFVANLVVLNKNKNDMENMFRFEEGILLGVSVTLPIVNTVILLMILLILAFDE